jgi:hypothetical protein
MGTQFNYAGIQLNYGYTTSNSINILGVSGAKLRKWKSPYKAKACFVCITNCLGSLRTSLKQYLFVAKKWFPTTILPRLGYVLFVKL